MSAPRILTGAEFQARKAELEAAGMPRGRNLDMPNGYATLRHFIGGRSPGNWRSLWDAHGILGTDEFMADAAGLGDPLAEIDDDYE